MVHIRILHFLELENCETTTLTFYGISGTFCQTFKEIFHLYMDSTLGRKGCSIK